MNYLEMFILVMAVILFTATAMVHHQSMATAADLVTNASHTVQSIQLAHEILDEIDCRLFTPKTSGLKFGDIVSQYDDTQRQYDLAYYGETFQLEINVEPCDDFGNSTTANKPNLLVTVVVHGPEGQKHPATLSRIYTPYSVEGL
jgi:Cu/Ag efflux protein CusF